MDRKSVRMSKNGPKSVKMSENGPKKCKNVRKWTEKV